MMVASVRSDAELAEVLGVPKTTISSWRNRNAIPSEWLIKFSSIYNVSLDEIVFGEPQLSSKRKMATALALSVLELVKPEIDVNDGWSNTWAKYLMFNSLIDLMHDLIELNSQGDSKKYQETSEHLLSDIEKHPSSYIERTVVDLELSFAVKIVPKGPQ